MSIRLEQIKKEVTMFLIITFVITFLMGVVMFFILKSNSEIKADTFGILQMLYPALAAIIVQLRYDKENVPRGLMKFFKIYIVTFGLAMGIFAVGVFVFPAKIGVVLNGLIVVASLITFIMICSGNPAAYEKINMVFTKNFKKVALLGLLFLGLKIITILFSIVIYGGLGETLKELVPKIILSIVNIPFGIALSYIIFFGEELGWREYLQIRLQILFGKKKGVIILGFIWGIWHLPLCFMLYSPETPIFCVISHVFYCMLMGIFLGYVYMKTENLWSVIIIHLINNTLAVSFNNGGYTQVISPTDLVAGIVISAIVFLPFIFTKEYRGEIHESKIGNSTNFYKEYNNL